MKKFFTLILMAAALVACTGIEQPEPIVEPTEKPATPQYFTLTVKASKSDSPVTKALTLDETTSPHTLNVTWNAGEKVIVCYYTTPIGELHSAASDDRTTTLSGQIDYYALMAARGESENWGPLRFYLHPVEISNDNSVEYSIGTHYVGQDGLLATIGSNFDFCSCAQVSSTGYTVNTRDHTVNISGGSIEFGANLQAIVKFKLLDANNDPINASSLTISAKKNGNSTLVKSWDPRYPTQFTYFEQSSVTDKLTVTPITSTYSTNGPGTLYTALRINTGINNDWSSDILLGATVDDATYYFEKANVSFEPGKYYEITVKMRPEQALPLANATSFSVGKVIGQDGRIYSNAAAADAAKTTAIAMIAYIGENTGESASHYTSGLAIALYDVATAKKYKDNNSNPKGGTSLSSDNFDVDGGLQYKVSENDGTAYPAFYAARFNNIPQPSGCSDWFLATGYQWQQMISCMGGFDAFRSAFQGIGGTNLEGKYWTSTQKKNTTTRAWCADFSKEKWDYDFMISELKVRPVFAFYYEQPPQGTPLKDVNATSLGKVIGQDGLVYDNATDAGKAGTEAAAIIAYVSEYTGESDYHYTLGLAVALNDCTGGLQYGTDTEYANSTLYTSSTNFQSESEGGIQYMLAHRSDPDFDSHWPAFSSAHNYQEPVPGCSDWFIGTGYQWQRIITVMGDVDLTALNLDGQYWLSTMSEPGKAWTVTFGNDISWDVETITDQHKVRPILAFKWDQRPQPEPQRTPIADVNDNSFIGKVIGLNGYVYDNAEAATADNTTAVATIAYVGEHTGESDNGFIHGLAIALNDCSESAKYNYYGYSTAANYTRNSTLVPYTLEDPEGDPEFPAEGGILYMQAHQLDANFTNTWPAFYAAYNYSDHVPGCSIWFIGTGWQWQQMLSATSSVGKDLYNYFKLRGPYWLSTMCNSPEADPSPSDNITAWNIVVDGEADAAWIKWYESYIYYSDSSSSKKVRPILAF